jgi:hypothetical protein
MMSKEIPESLELTPASEIKKLREEREQGVPVKLPSGIIVSIRKPNLSKLIESGDIPSELLSMALGKEGIDLGHYDADSVQKGIKMMNLMVKHSLVSPKVVENNPKEDEILVDDLSEDDKAFIVGEAQSEVGKLKSFRKEQGSEKSS